MLNLLSYHAVLMLAALTVQAQPAEDLRKFIETIWPDAHRMHRLRFNDIASHMKLRPGASVADVGCGSGEIAVILSRAVGAERPGLRG